MKKLTGKEGTTWNWLSKYIRLRDSDENGWCKCCTCGKVKFWKEMQAGHFVTRDCNATAWEEENLNSQCPYCNDHKKGEQWKHGEYIDNLYGKGTAEYLKSLDGQYNKKKSDDEIDEIKKHYRELISKLDNKHLLKE